MRQLKLAELELEAGNILGTSDWLTVSQHAIDLFAEATGDHQWIHVDPRRAAEGPFGQTIAHGYLTLSLLAQLLPQVLDITDQTMGVNYGIEKLRFTGPVPAGARIRLHATLLGSAPKAGGILNRIGINIEVEGEDKPALVGETLFLAYGPRATRTSGDQRTDLLGVETALGPEPAS